MRPFMEIFSSRNMKKSHRVNSNSKKQMSKVDVPTLYLFVGQKLLLLKVLHEKVGAKSTRPTKYLVCFYKYTAINIPKLESKMLG
jgi:hypothetical protein